MSESTQPFDNLPKPGRLGGRFASVPKTLIIRDVESTDPDVAFRPVPIDHYLEYHQQTDELSETQPNT